MPYKDQEKQRKFQAQWHQENKVKMKTRVNHDRKVINEFLWKHKSENPCIDCGESDPIVLQFDHVRGTKKYPMARISKLTRNLKIVKREVAKCEVRCANCHQRKTHERKLKENPNYRNYTSS